MTWLWLGDLFAAAHGLSGILLAQAVMVLLPTVVYAAASAGIVAELGLRTVRVPVLGSAVALGIAMSIITSHIALWQERWLRPDPVELEAMKRLADAITGSPGRALLALALAPAIAEEALFRGLVLGRLRRHCGAGAAVALSALAFAMIHRSPMRFLPPLVLGIVLGIVSVRTGSSVPAMLLHFTYNLAILGFSMGWVREPVEHGDLAAAIAVTGLLLCSSAWWGSRVDITLRSGTISRRPPG